MIINGVAWRVKLVSPAHPLLITPWQTHALGVCDKITQTICIDETLPLSLLKQVLCHELVHAFMYSYMIDLTYEEEEQMAEVFSLYGKDIIFYTNAIYEDLKIK